MPKVGEVLAVRINMVFPFFEASAVGVKAL
jgi:hypothetical protein